MYSKKALAAIKQGIVASLLLLLVACTNQAALHDGPPPVNVDVSKIPDAVPRPLAVSKYGNPAYYSVYGKRYYVLKTADGYDQRGIASWYGTKFHGQLTSTREPYDMYSMTAASPVLPIPCFVRVTNLQNGKSVIVKVNDRGPFATNRILDLSYVAAKKLGYENQGTALVDVQAINFDQPLQPHVMLATNRQLTPKLYLQLGAFHDFANAEKIKMEATHLTHHNVTIAKRLQDHRYVYRVQLGPLHNVAESDSVYNQLTRLGIGHPITVVG